MIINYKLIIFIYCPVLLLLIIRKLKDRFEPRNEALRSCSWSLTMPSILLFLTLTAEVIISLWHAQIMPILKKIPYSDLNFEIFNLLYMCSILILIFIFLRYIHKVSIIEVFRLKLSQTSFILKLCAVLTVINMLSLYFCDFNLLLNPQSSDLEYIKSLNVGQFALVYFDTIILAPILEESLCRGLIYGPLYRKVGRGFAMVLSSLIWAIGHFESLLPSIGLLMVGIFMAWLYDRRGSLLHPIIFHMFKNSWLILYL